MNFLTKRSGNGSFSCKTFRPLFFTFVNHRFPPILLGIFITKTKIIENRWEPSVGKVHKGWANTWHSIRLSMSFCPTWLRLKQRSSRLPDRGNIIRAELFSIDPEHFFVRNGNPMILSLRVIFCGYSSVEISNLCIFRQ